MTTKIKQLFYKILPHTFSTNSLKRKQVMFFRARWTQLVSSCDWAQLISSRRKSSENENMVASLSRLPVTDCLKVRTLLHSTVPTRASLLRGLREQCREEKTQVTFTGFTESSSEYPGPAEEQIPSLKNGVSLDLQSFWSVWIVCLQYHRLQLQSRLLKHSSEYERPLATCVCCI